MIRSGTPPARAFSHVGPAIAAVALAMLVALVLPKAAAADPMYWGGTIKGETYGMTGEAPTSSAVLERFEHDAGKAITIVNNGQSWANFDATTMNAAIAAGEIPLVTMPLEATLKEVNEGKQDAKIRAWARAAKAFGYPFLFRPWWEPNGNWYSWGRNSTESTQVRSAEYVKAWQHFHDLVEEEGATNVTWDWVVNTIWSDPESKPGPWYPGPEYVDWVGVDAYNWGKNPIQPDRWLTAEESIQPTLNELEMIAPGKPVCICESASTEFGEGGPNQTKPIWIHEMLDTYLPSHPEIKAYLWFNWNVEKPSVPGKRFDWPIESSAAAEAAFREGIAAPDYLSTLPPLTKLAKVPTPVLPPAPEVPGAPTGGTPPAVTAPLSPVPSPPSTSSPAPTGAVSAARAESGVAGRVAFGAPRPQPSSGSAKLPLWIPGPGSLKISVRGAQVSIPALAGPARGAITREVPATERLMLQVTAIGPSLRALLGQGKTTATVLVRFTPTGGAPSVRRLQLTLRAQT